MSDYLQRFNARRALRFKLVAAAAAIVLVATAALMLQGQSHKVNSVPQTASGGSSDPVKPPMNDVPPVGTQLAKAEAPLPVVDYTVVSSTRGPKPPETASESLVLQEGKRLRVRIHLPLGSATGEYEVRLHRKADKKEVLRAYRSAAKENHFILAIEEDFAKFPPGSYLLAIFPPGWKEEVQAHPVRIVSSLQK